MIHHAGPAEKVFQINAGFRWHDILEFLTYKSNMKIGWVGMPDTALRGKPHGEVSHEEDHQGIHDSGRTG